MRINTRQELEQRRKEYAASLKMQKKQILICAGTGCVAGGSLDIYARIQEILKERGIKCSLVLEKEPHEISEDELKDAEDSIQKITDKYIT